MSKKTSPDARRALNLSDPVTVKEGETEYRRCEWKKPVSPVDSMTVTFDGDKKIDAIDCAVKRGNPEAKSFRAAFAALHHF